MSSFNGILYTGGGEMKDKKGFTLTELIAVIAILGILMTVAGVAVFGVMGESQKKLLEEQINGLADTSITYVLSEKLYLESCPASFTPENPTSSGCYTSVSVAELVQSGFFENKNDLCDLHKEILVYRDSIGELQSYVPENTCSY